MNVVPNRCRGKQLWSSSESSDSDYEGRNKGSQPLGITEYNVMNF